MSATSIIKESLKYPNFHRKNWGLWVLFSFNFSNIEFN